jgi:spectrin alpha
MLQVAHVPWGFPFYFSFACQSYRDPTNLRGKLQRHQAFEAELAANQSRIDAVSSFGQDLVAGSHFAAEEISARVSELQALWAKLRAQSADKGQKLKEANEQQQFNNAVQDIDQWCQEVETALASEDFGKDLTSVKNLLKKHQLLEVDIAGHKDRIDAVTAQVSLFPFRRPPMAERREET